MITLFSSRDIKKIADEIKWRQKMESNYWTDENGEVHELSDKELFVDRIEASIDMFVDELCRRFPVEDNTDKDIAYFSDDTPRLTEK